MIRHSQIEALRRRIAFEDAMAQHAASLQERQGHADLALHYRAEMRELRAREMSRFAGMPEMG